MGQFWRAPKIVLDFNGFFVTILLETSATACRIPMPGGTERRILSFLVGSSMDAEKKGTALWSVSSNSQVTSVSISSPFASVF